MTPEILCITGGVGGAKLARGFYLALAPGRLALAINCGDDFEHLGLEIWPDFDTTLYTLAGVADPDRGWGRADESWLFLDTVERLGGESWFRIGDRDLAVHLLRRGWLDESADRETIARRLTEAFDVQAQLIPAAATPVRTMVDTAGETLAFQDYFVRRRAEPRVDAIRYEGAAEATLCPAVDAALSSSDLRGVVIAPSNPWLSVGPTLAIPDWRSALESARVPVVAVSPIIGGEAVKGPTAKIMAELGLEVSAVSIARFYSGLADAFVLDRVDAHLEGEIRALGMDCLVAPTLMRDDRDKRALALSIADFLDRLDRRSDRGRRAA